MPAPSNAASANRIALSIAAATAFVVFYSAALVGLAIMGCA